MATKKEVTTSDDITVSKVRNRKATIKNEGNKISESLLQRSFVPLMSSKDNKARLTFQGVKHSIIKWTKDGEKKEKPKLELAFSVLDVTHDAPQTIAISCDYRLSTTNRLGRVLVLMGFVFKDKTENIDADDEFGIKATYNDPSEVFDFLREKCGLVYKAELTTAIRKNKTTGEKYEAKGLWDIVPESLEPKLRNGEQERDLMTTDVSDEDFLNPNIDMSSESD